MDKWKRTRGDKAFDIVNVTLLTIGCLLVLYPLYFIVIASISDPNRVFAGDVLLLPKDITFDGFKRIFQDDNIVNGFKNTLLYATLGTAISVSLTVTSGYALSRKDLPGRHIIMMFLVVTLFFHGGMIPTYLVVRDLGMVNTIWAMVIPNAVGLWNVIICRTFFQTSIPKDMLEAAQIDGCTDFRFFAKIVLPLSKPIIAVMVLFHVVTHWNSFFDALIYLNNDSLYPLQLILRNLLIQSEASTQMIGDIESNQVQLAVAEQIKYGVIIVSSLPLLVLYPFLQKYFVKGVMIGSIKG
ncbi:carbohydrate ABC transporter permease [Shouchella clausii]|uniref:Sugar ABC transporter permease n=1 Tax=Shouchella clausii TaxID=79880 RepID=A0A268RXL4_SHOCL|nr:carbohydrate ABC transporter permease [Shouchella clausii]PAD43245.1 sugar ABC transporter permease [Bacillus sp. 7520-S]MBU8596678.1 carbohydrate ABC transporter permease [Shouchella clausii]MCM3550311.1 carbohydrate ABC transporter permease [Shouchella clausii]MCY1106022.1 carbohydrate ABC transporter permease [Shouchella clausii]MEB5478627.1 carbohydrate ABC transporter permease [Shouchella clausii]